LSLFAGESDKADLRLKFGPQDKLNYVWSINSISDSHGKEKGRAFTLSADSTFGMTLAITVLPGRKGDLVPVSVRMRDQTYADKRSIEDSKTDLYIAKGKMKYSENGKVVIDSDNDIGLDRFAEYQEQFKNSENAEMRVTLDPAGRQSDVQGDPAIVESIRNSGAQGIFPILAGKEVAPGESWEDQYEMPKLGDFKLARPALVKSRTTFSKWEMRDGKRFALLDIGWKWDSQELKGENSEGLLVEITRIDGKGAGTCLFDPETGRYVEGTLMFAMKYRIDGEKDGQSSGLDVSGKTRFSFTLQNK